MPERPVTVSRIQWLGDMRTDWQKDKLTYVREQIANITKDVKPIEKQMRDIQEDMQKIVDDLNTLQKAAYRIIDDAIQALERSK